jgi:hypothetical protein
MNTEFDWSNGGKAKTRAALLTALRQTAQVLRGWRAAGE